MRSSLAYPLALVYHRFASLPAVAASLSRRFASLVLDFTVLGLFDFAAACRALSASARLVDSLIRYSPAFFSASVRCLRFCSSCRRT